MFLSLEFTIQNFQAESRKGWGEYLSKVKTDLEDWIVFSVRDV